MGVAHISQKTIAFSSCCMYMALQSDFMFLCTIWSHEAAHKNNRHGQRRF